MTDTNPPSETDAVLLEKARSGDLSAFNELVVTHQGAVFGLCFRMTGDRQAAEDAAQEAFISAWRNLKGLRGSSFRGWVMRIAANASTDELRRRGRRPSSSLDAAFEAGVPEPADDEPLPETATLHHELRAQVEEALQKLPSEQRLSVVLADLHGFDYSEVAEILKTSIGTVKSRIARGRGRLREVLRGEMEPFASEPRQEV